MTKPKTAEPATVSLWQVNKIIQELDRPVFAELRAVDWHTNDDRGRKQRAHNWDDGAALAPIYGEGSMLMVEVTKIEGVAPGDILISEFRKASPVEIRPPRPKDDVEGGE